MRLLMFILRLVFGFTFILSGFFKLVDPVGTGLIVSEYLGVMHLKFLTFGAIPFGMVLSVTELLVGVAILMRMRMKLASLIGMIMTVIFTIITLFLLLFNPIQDCGCFGEAVHLSNTQTFIKNLVLLVCIVPIFCYRKRFRRVAHNEAEWTFLLAYGVVAISVTLFSYFRMPVADFGNFKTGTNVSVRLDEASQGMEFQTAFIYEKDGRTREFRIENLPDSTWTFVKTVDVARIGSSRAPFDFSISDKNGNYITQELLNTNIPIIFCIVTNFEKFSNASRWASLASLSEEMKANGGELLVLVSAAPAQVEEALSGYGAALPLNFGYSDYKTLISMHRSNGGYVYMDDAVIIKKWPRGALSPMEASEIILGDSEMVMTKDIIKRQLIYEVSIVAIFLSIILMRYVCGIVYSRKQKFFA